MKKSDFCFWENGVGLADAKALSAADAARIGLTLGRLRPGAIVGVGSASTPASRALLYGVEAGLLEAGGAVWDFGSCFESQFGYCVSRSMADYGVYADVSGDGAVKLLARGGLPLGASSEKQFLERIGREEPSATLYSAYGSVLPMESLRELYRIELIKSAIGTLAGMMVAVKCAAASVQNLMEEALIRLGARMGEGGLTLQITADGRNVSAYDKVSDYIFTDRILLLACLDLFGRGQDVAVAASAPHILDRMAEPFGRKVFRYEDGFASNSDHGARNLGLRQPFLRDGLMLGIRLVSLLKENHCTLEELERRLPGYATVARTIAAAGGGSLLTGETGICLAVGEGEIRVRRSRAGKAVFLVAEGCNAETAGELCRFAEEELLNHRFPGQQ